MIVLYSTNCPACKILEAKLTNANINFQINNDIDKIISMGFTSAPILQINENFLTYKQAIEWLRKGE